ncbi:MULTISPECIES: DMT family transporter [unclassified Pseudomonas]|uniref:DMT family transporter n=1 Tax=unclassified Pseudomonas TaxID=196821 RepID=UPI002449DF08|nr:MULTISPECIES: DMT family transporter [unclassified Pseudomonas]MDH0894770.1 DMT family transporter [Pseudomonas sp. GD03875]MDH1065161.1 DMT family transporter [Pseudomonas sp. GD03985]
MPNGWLILLPLLAGAMLALQAGINGQLAKSLPGVLAASLVSFAVGGAALLLLALVLAGQLGMALLLDHHGWAGFRESPLTLGKVLGLALIVGGIWLIRRG